MMPEQWPRKDGRLLVARYVEQLGVYDVSESVPLARMLHPHTGPIVIMP